jgi:hypothetical protein
VYVGLFVWDGWLYRESLYIFLQTAFLFALMRMQRDSRRVWRGAERVSLGLAALTRPNGVVKMHLPPAEMCEKHHAHSLATCVTLARSGRLRAFPACATSGHV